MKYARLDRVTVNSLSIVSKPRVVWLGVANGTKFGALTEYRLFLVRHARVVSVFAVEHPFWIFAPPQFSRSVATRRGMRLQYVWTPSAWVGVGEKLVELKLRTCMAGVLLISLIATESAHAWGRRGHAVVDRAAVLALPNDGPIFLRQYLDYIGDSAGYPDGWRDQSIPFSKIEEDPNHGWFLEQFSFMDPIPRSRYEFVIELYKENLKLAKKDPEAAKKTNVRWTGTLPFAALEVYGHLVAEFRLLRQAQVNKQDTSHLQMTCAMLTWWLGHYIGDGAQPLHDTIQHDGWQGPNPHGYTRDHSIHGRFESQYVDLINLNESAIVPRVAGVGHLQGDVFDLVLRFLKESNSHVEEVYQLDQRRAFSEAGNKEARELVYSRITAGATMLRDLLYRAWLESGEGRGREAIDPTSENNPHYNPETGTAAAGISPAIRP